MTQRLSTKIGSQAGLETNIQSDQTQGYQIADNIIYRPVGGLSKRRGSKKLVETVSGETKRLVSPTQDNSGVLSIQEVDSTGNAKVLGYKKEGVRADLYCLEGSSKVLLNPDSAFTPYDKIRLDFDSSVYTDDLDFVENGFQNKLGAFCVFFAPQNSFDTVAVEQDSVDPDLLRVSRFVNLPIKTDEIAISNPTSLSVAPTLLVNYDIISVSADYFTIYPNGGTPPAWTSTGDAGTLTITFNTFKVIEVNENALSSEELMGSKAQVFYETQGLTPSPFSTSQVSLCLENRSGDEIVFNADQGQMYFSDENPDAPKVSYYGVDQALDCVGFYQKIVSNFNESGPIYGNFSYRSVFKKIINDQTFLGAPSPIFRSYISGSFTGTVALFAGDLTITGLTNIGDNVFIVIKDTVVSTPAITKASVFKATWTGAAYSISAEEQIKVLGFAITVFPSTPNLAQFGRTNFCSVTIPENFYYDYLRNQNLSNHQYFIDIYRSNQIEDLSINSSEFFLVKSEELSGDYPLKHILVKDNEIYNSDLEAQLPLYTNPAEEGPLKQNSLAPRHQNFVEKNGVFYLGDLTQKTLILYNNSANAVLDFSTREPTIEASTTEVSVAGQSIISGLTDYFYNILDVSLVTGILDYGTFDSTGVIEGTYLTPYATGGYFLCSDIDSGSSFVGYVSDTTTPTAYHLRSLNGEINALDETKTLKVIYQPLWFSDGATLKLLSIDIFLGFSTTFLGKADYVYALIYRSINLSFTENPSWVTTGISVVNYYQKSNFILSFLANYTNSIVPELNFSLQRKSYTPYLSTFPSWLFIEEKPDENFDLQTFRYQIAYSKPFEPAAYPQLQFLQVGSTRNVIYGIFSVRDSLIIASKEGFYRLTGDTELDYVLTLIENDTVPLSPLLMTEQQDRVFALTQKGFGACSENNFQIIDLPVQDITERFLQLYRDDLDTFTVRQAYTAGPRFLNQIVFYLPSLKEKDLSKSVFGLSLDSSIMSFSTVDLYVDDEKKTGVLLHSFDASRFLNESYGVPSFQPSSLQVVRAEVTRSDFAQNECPIELGTFWQATASINSRSSILTVTTTLDHRLQAGDYVTLIFGEAFVTLATGLSASLFQDAVYLVDSSGGDPKVFTVDLGSVSGVAISSQEVRFRFGRSGLPVTLDLTTGSPLCTLTLASQADVGWLVGQSILLQRPYSASLSSVESLLLTNKSITSISLNTLEISLPANSTITASVPAVISEDVRAPYKQTFSFVAPNFNNQNDFGILERNENLIFPFQSEDKGSRIQGFLERPLDTQWKPDRPSKIFSGVQSTLMTSRITGGDPCSLKNFGQVIIAMQSIFSMSKVNLSFQGDRYDAVQGVVFRSQNNIDAPFDPAFADILWSTILQQWASITNPHAGWKEGAPFTPIRITTPTNVAQSTYLSIFLRHDRPFETFALGSIAVNGVFIDPTSAGV